MGVIKDRLSVPFGDVGPDVLQGAPGPDRLVVRGHLHDDVPHDLAHHVVAQAQVVAAGQLLKVVVVVAVHRIHGLPRPGPDHAPPQVHLHRGVLGLVDAAHALDQHVPVEVAGVPDAWQAVLAVPHGPSLHVEHHHRGPELGVHGDQPVAAAAGAEGHQGPALICPPRVVDHQLGGRHVQGQLAGGVLQRGGARLAFASAGAGLQDVGGLGVHAEHQQQVAGLQPGAGHPMAHHCPGLPELHHRRGADAGAPADETGELVEGVALHLDLEDQQRGGCVRGGVRAEVRSRGARLGAGPVGEDATVIQGRRVAARATGRC